MSLKHKKRSPAFPLEPNKAEYCLVGDKKKRKYSTQFEAELLSPATTVQQYVCDYCGYWHNGNSHTSRERARKSSE